MATKKRIFMFAALIAVSLTLGCKVRYTLSNAYISPEIKTVTIAFFPNTAPMVAPILSPTFTTALQDRFARQTKLTQVREDGDLMFEGEIVGYTSQGTAVTAEEYASKNRLTITVRVRFTNKIQPEANFTKNFSQYLDYDSNQMLQEVEPALIPEIVDMLVDDIFNAAVSGW